MVLCIRQCVVWYSSSCGTWPTTVADGATKFALTFGLAFLYATFAVEGSTERKHSNRVSNPQLEYNTTAHLILIQRPHVSPQPHYSKHIHRSNSRAITPQQQHPFNPQPHATQYTHTNTHIYPHPNLTLPFPFKHSKHSQCSV